MAISVARLFSSSLVRHAYRPRGLPHTFPCYVLLPRFVLRFVSLFAPHQGRSWFQGMLQNCDYWSNEFLRHDIYAIKSQVLWLLADSCANASFRPCRNSVIPHTALLEHVAVQYKGSMPMPRVRRLASEHHYPRSTTGHNITRQFVFINICNVQIYSLS